MAMTAEKKGGQRLAEKYEKVVDGFATVGEAMTDYEQLEPHLSALNEAYQAIEAWKDSLWEVEPQDRVRRHFADKANMQKTLKVLRRIEKALGNAEELSADLDEPSADEDDISTKLTSQLNAIKDDIIVLVNLYPAVSENNLSLAQVQRQTEPQASSFQSRGVEELSGDGDPDSSRRDQPHALKGRVVVRSKGGHQILNMFVSNGSRVKTGDWIADPEHVFANPDILGKLKSHTADGIHVDKNSTVLIGNQIGGRSFWY